MPYGPYDPLTHAPAGHYDMYVAEFSLDGIQYQIVAEQLAFEEADCQDLFTAVMKLDRAKRIVVVLYYLEGYQIQEIAGILKIPPGTVGTRLARARKELRKYLEEEVSV